MTVTLTFTNIDQLRQTLINAGMDAISAHVAAAKMIAQAEEQDTRQQQHNRVSWQGLGSASEFRCCEGYGAFF